MRSMKLFRKREQALTVFFSSEVYIPIQLTSRIIHSYPPKIHVNKPQNFYPSPTLSDTDQLSSRAFIATIANLFRAETIARFDVIRPKFERRVIARRAAIVDEFIIFANVCFSWT